MHRLDVDAQVRSEVPGGADVCGQVAGRERCTAPVVDVHPVVVRQELVAVERGVGICDRPTTCVRARPLRRRGSGRRVPRRRHRCRRGRTDARRDPVVGVDFDDAEQLDAECLGPLVAARYADTSECEALPAGRDDGRLEFLAPTSATARIFAICGISTAVGSRRSPPGDDRHCKCRRPSSPPWRPSRGPRSTC